MCLMKSACHQMIWKCESACESLYIFINKYRRDERENKLLLASFCSGSSETTVALCSATSPPRRGWACLELLTDLPRLPYETREEPFTCFDFSVL